MGATAHKYSDIFWRHRRMALLGVLLTIGVSWINVCMTPQAVVTAVIEPAAIQPIDKTIDPTTPHLLLTSLVGLLLTIGLVAVSESRSRTIRTFEEIETRLGLPVMGVIQQAQTRFPDPYAPQLVTVQAPASSGSRAFRRLGRKVQRAQTGAPLHTLLITAPHPSSSKCNVAANLAAALAQTGKEVVLVEANLQRPQLRHLFAQQANVGLSEVLQDDTRPWVTALRLTAVNHLTTVSGGSVPAGPGVSLGSSHMRTFLEQLCNISEMVIISGPALSVPDAAALVSQVEGVLLVIDQGKTSWQAAQVAVEELRHSGARVVGVVVNGVRSAGDWQLAVGGWKLAVSRWRLVVGH